MNRNKTTRLDDATPRYLCASAEELEAAAARIRPSWAPDAPGDLIWERPARTNSSLEQCPFGDR
jgi:hypothetical protein